MELGDQPHDVQAEAEVGTAVVAAASGLPERLEEPAADLGRQRRPGVIDLQHRGVRLEAQPDRDRGARQAEVRSIVDQLIEHLHDQVWSSLNRGCFARQLRRKAAIRKGDPVRSDRRGKQRDEIKSGALRTADRLFHARRGPHRYQDCVQALAALSSALQIRPYGAGHIFGFEVLEGRAHDRERSADLVGELAGECTQIAGVLVEPAEERREAARDVPKLIGSGCFRKRRDEPLARQGRFAGAPQSGQTHGEPRREREHRDHGDGARDQSEVEHSRQRAVAQPEPPIGRLRDQQSADDLTVVAIVDGSGGFDEPPFAGPVDEPAVEACEDPGLWTQLARAGECVGSGEGAPCRGRHGKAQARLQELREIPAELGSSQDEAPDGVQIIAAKGAETHGRRAALVAIVDQRAKASAEH